jgi:hypothetical protein
MATEFKIPLHRFDTNLLPAEARQVGTEAFKTAVMLHFAAEYAAQGQTAMVTVDDQEITVMAFPAEASALDFVHADAQGRQDRRGRALPGEPDQVRAGQRGGSLQPGHRLQRTGPVRRGHHPAQACRAAGPRPRPRLGWHRQCVSPHAQARTGAQAFEKAVEADPNDGYTRRNLGGMLIGFKRIDEAVTHLRHALA